MGWNMDPWREMDRMRRELESALGTFAGPVARRVFPPLNIYDSGEEIIVTAELAGLTKDDVKVLFTDGVLSLSGTRSLPGTFERMTALRQERPSGRFEKSLEIPVKIDVEKISASFRNGVITITLPKAAEARPKEIAVAIE
jgi:HSP20 family protein